MSAFTPEQARMVLAIELPSVFAERPVTRSVIGAIELAWHIVMAENRFLEAVVGREFDLAPRPRPDEVRTPAEVNAWYDERLPMHLERLKALSGEDLVKPIEFRGPEAGALGAILALPAVAFLRIGLNHTIHHRGQLSMYLRPMGAAVPSIYGESFDARTGREAARQR
jgi:uncharacterized damage-inducible protein DinB